MDPEEIDEPNTETDSDQEREHEHMKYYGDVYNIHHPEPDVALT